MMLATSSVRRAATRSLLSGKVWAAPVSANINRRFATVPTDSEGEAPPPPPTETPLAPPTVSKQAADKLADELNNNLRPSEIVSALDRHIVGQKDAKKAVAIAMRNRWRRRQLPDELRKEVTPRNVLLVGPTGKLFDFESNADAVSGSFSNAFLSC